MCYTEHMKKSLLVILTAVASIFIANYLVLAFTEPTGAPPTNNVPAPINVGSGRQIKTGDLTVGNLKASSITLGEDTRTAWPSGGSGGSCTWAGNKCRCSTSRAQFDKGWFSGGYTVTVRNMTYMTCQGGAITDFQNSIELIPGTDFCPSPEQAAEWYNCAPGQYYGN